MATIYTVTQLNAYVGNLFREDFLLAGLRVQGELSNVKYHASGHIYFTLKDSGAELRGVIYRQNALGLGMRLADGMQVVCTGAVTVYEKAGVYQLNTKTVEKLGQGELYALYQARLRALEAEGLFDAAHKKPLPRFVLTLGVVTSPSGAAIHDIQTVARQQNPYVKIVLYPALVQGEGAAESIVRGIRTLDRRGVDLMIVGRGGGSLEDLWCFNDERVARAAYACETPLISAVGHESDVTLLDFVADLRAATPSAAAERGVPNLAAQLALIAGLATVPGASGESGRSPRARKRGRLPASAERTRGIAQRETAAHPRTAAGTRGRTEQKDTGAAGGVSAARGAPSRGFSAQSSDRRLCLCRPCGRHSRAERRKPLDGRAAQPSLPGRRGGGQSRRNQERTAGGEPWTKSLSRRRSR